MGIKNFMKIIQKYAPGAISLTKINKYKNKTIAFDANLLIYKMIYAIRLNGYDIKNDDTIITHIHAFLLKMKGFIKYSITPVFVFDGMPPSIKNDTLKQRNEFQKAMQKKYFSAVTQDEQKKYYFMKSDISYQEITECVELINIFGYTVINAPEEADAQLVELLNNKKVDYVATDDMDILIFGGEKILKNFTISDAKKIQEINLNVIKTQTNLTHKKIIDLAILLGCDYCPSVKGIGTIGAYKYIQKYGTIEKIIKNENIQLGYDFNKARRYFINPPTTNTKKIKINKINLNKQKLNIFLNRFNYKKDYVIELLKSI